MACGGCAKHRSCHRGKTADRVDYAATFRHPTAEPVRVARRGSDKTARKTTTARSVGGAASERAADERPRQPGAPGAVRLVGCERQATVPVSRRHASTTPGAAGARAGVCAPGGRSAMAATERGGGAPDDPGQSARGRAAEGYAGSSTAWMVSRRPKRGRKPSSALARRPSTMHT